MALGFRAHSGWAALVAVGGPPRAPVVVDRRRIEFVDPGISGAKQPYHAAAEMELKEAERYLRGCAARTKFLARRALRAVVNDLRKRGHDVVGCGLLLGSGRPATTLAATLAAHPLIHTAEGEFFRNALVEASEHCDLAVTGVRERELLARGVAELRLPVGELQRRLTELGRPLGPPWRLDEKLGALVAWLVLVARSRSSRR